MIEINVLDDEQIPDVFESRMEICKQCPLYKETSSGPICNPQLYINEEDKTTVSDRPKLGYKRGCSCSLKRKAKLSMAHCIVNKW